MGYLRKYINKYGFLFTVAILFLIVEAICDLLLPTILASIIDKGIANKDMQYVFEKGGLMLLVTGIGAVSAIVRNILSSNISQKFGAELRFDLYKKIQSKSPGLYPRLSRINHLDCDFFKYTYTGYPIAVIPIPIMV